ncbi:MAG: extracellular solute-binding protein [Spirochaetes bacterium]|nr:extracellular solute-binding protein [Spirochaetota bacterium]MBU0954716.1 extracellular solute-binding protein [Spirochaetota bacterium]
MFKRSLAVIFSLVLLFPLIGQTTIRLAGWPGNPTEEAAMKKMIDNFNSKNRDIVVVWEPSPGDHNQAMKTRLAGGTAADLFYLDVSIFEEFAKTGALLPLDAYLRDFPLNDYAQSLRDAFSYNSRIYGIAKDFSTLSVIYNKEIFRRAGVAEPRAGWTWNDFRTTALALKAKSIVPSILEADFNRWIPFVQSFGGRVVDERMNIALGETKAVSGLRFAANLVLRDQVAVRSSDVGAGWEGEAFGQEKVAMIMSGPWSVGFVRDNYPNVYKNIGVIEMPRNEQSATMIYTVAWVINKQTANRAAALRVLKYLVSEGQEIFVREAGVLGSSSTVAARDTDPLKAPFYRGAAYGTPWRIRTPSGLFSRANDEIGSRLQDVYAKKITIDQAVQQIVANYESWVE